MNRFILFGIASSISGALILDFTQLAFTGLTLFVLGLMTVLITLLR